MLLFIVLIVCVSAFPEPCNVDMRILSNLATNSFLLFPFSAVLDVLAVSFVSFFCHNQTLVIFLDCRDPPTPTHGEVRLTTADFTTYGATAVQSCEEGYDLVGNELIICLADGNWSTSIVCLLKSQFSLFFIILPYIYR